MKNLFKIKTDLYLETLKQKKGAWLIKDFDKSNELRKKEIINYEKYKLIAGIIKANERGKKNGKNE